MASQQYWIWLAERPQVGPRGAAKLLAQFGAPEHIYAADRVAFASAGLTKLQTDSLCDKSLAEAEEIIKACAEKQIAIVTYADALYPDALRTLDDPPVVLYVRGTLPDFDGQPAIAIVGTRRASGYGLTTAEQMATSLSQAGFLIVSGMASGIDSAANRGALCGGGKTVAVLGCGVDICYPAQNQLLMGDIIASGAVISAYPPGTEPSKKHFPARNRIISGLCKGTLVVEAPKRSGALITARFALEQGRDVFAVPGNLDAVGFSGTNELIAAGEAQLVTGPTDIIREYAGFLRDRPDEARIRVAFRRQTEPSEEKDAPSLWEQITAREKRGNLRRAAQSSPMADNTETALPETLSDSERTVALAVRAGAQTPDAIIERTGLLAAQVMAAITMLELDGVLYRNEGRISCP